MGDPIFTLSLLKPLTNQTDLATIDEWMERKINNTDNNGTVSVFQSCWVNDKKPYVDPSTLPKQPDAPSHSDLMQTFETCNFGEQQAVRQIFKACMVKANLNPTYMAQCRKTLVDTLAGSEGNIFSPVTGDTSLRLFVSTAAQEAQSTVQQQCTRGILWHIRHADEVPCGTAAESTTYTAVLQLLCELHSPASDSNHGRIYGHCCGHRKRHHRRNELLQ